LRATDEKQAAQLVPNPIYDAVWEENMSFFQDKNIFDPDYFDFLWSFIKLDRSSAVEGYLLLHGGMHPTAEAYNGQIPACFLCTDATLPVDPKHPTMRAIELGCRFIVETLAHAKEKGSLSNYVTYLKTLFSRHTPASRVRCLATAAVVLVVGRLIPGIPCLSGYWKSWKRR